MTAFQAGPESAGGEPGLSTQDLEAVLDGMPALAYVKDADGRYRYVNRACEDAFDMRREEFLGRTAAELFSDEVAASFARHDERVLSEGAPMEEEQVVSFGGKRRVYLTRKRPLLDSDAAPRAVFGVSTDITEHAEAQERLRDADARFRAAFEGAPLGMAIVSVEAGTFGQILQVNPALCGFTGYSEAELYSRDFQGITHPDDVEADVNALRRVLVGELESVELEKRYIRADGSVAWGRLHTSVVFGSDGAPRYAIGEVQDITSQRASEERLREAEQRFRGAFEEAPIGMALTDPSGVFMRVNPALGRLTGYHPEELVGRSFQSITHPDDVPPDVAALEAVASGLHDSYTTEKRYERRDGSWVPVLVNASVVRDEQGASLYFVSQMQDISAARREERLRLAQLGVAGSLAESKGLEGGLSGLLERFSAAMGWTNGAVWLGDADQGRLDRVVTWPPTPAADGETSSDGPGRAPAGDLVEQVWQEGRPLTSRDDADAGELAFPILADDRPIGVIGFSGEGAGELDLGLQSLLSSLSGQVGAFVTHRRAEARAREVADRLQAILDHTETCVFLKDLEGRYTLVNRRFRQLLGRSEDEILGRTDYDVFPRGFADRCTATDQRVLTSLRPAEVEDRHPAGDGEVVFLTFKTALIDGEGEPWGLCGISTDITDRQRAEEEREALEERLRAAQRLESVGRLAGGVAHDFNNLLAVITNYAEFARAAVGADHPAREDIDQVVTAAARGAALTRQLLTFSRRDLVRAEVLDLNYVVSETERLLGRTIGEDIELVTVLEPEARRVRVDRSRVEQVLVNLAVNARDAMPAGGRVTIETRNLDLDRRLPCVGTVLEPGDYVTLTVSDTGEGMDAETVSQAFEPFFTTKRVGEGTGLGLATVYGVVSRAGGGVTLESSPGSGTSLRIILPATAEQVADEEAEVAGLPERSAARILVVEDEEALLPVLGRILRDAGHSVLEAAGPEQALELAGGEGGGLDLLVTDLVMPVMGGLELADELRRRDPGLRVLFVSGYSEDFAGRPDTGEDIQLLEKPFDERQLLREVNGALDRAAPS